MPKLAEYTVSWSSTKQRYIISHTYLYSSEYASVIIGSPSWFEWLASVQSFCFRAAEGYTFTVRKEIKQRGTAYWVGYRKVQGKLKKQYLGTSKTLSSKTLEQAARILAGVATQSKQKQERKSSLFVFDRTNELPSALRIFGFSFVPSASALKKRYRELAKNHHPDARGNHLDMVAINQAYAFLDKYIRSHSIFASRSNGL